MKTLYVINGSRGEYSTREEWQVCYVTDEDKAKEVVLELTHAQQELRALYKAETDWDYEKEQKFKNEHWIDIRDQYVLDKAQEQAEQNRYFSYVVEDYFSDVVTYWYVEVPFYKGTAA